MDDPNITIEVYIRLEEEKAQRHDRTFNWQTDTYGKMKYYEDEDNSITNFKTEYPAIVFNDTLTTNVAVSCEPTVSPLNENEIDFRISFDESDDEDYIVGNKMHKAFPLPVKIVATTRRKEIPLPEVCTAIEEKKKNLPEVIEFGDSYKVPTNTDPDNATTRKDDEQSGRTVTITTEDMQRNKNDVKARITLLLSLPDEHQLRFSKFKTAKELWAAILKTFGEVEKDDLNQKFLTSLAPEWLMHTIDIAFISSSKNNSNEDGNTACVTTASTAFPTGSVNVATISQDTANKFWKRTGKKISIQGSDVAGFDKS
nr:hypothetical protein [Tanacetum cinerariifolium]